MKSRVSLEEKLAWMRQRQGERAEKEAAGEPFLGRQISLEKAQRARHEPPDRLRVYRVPEVAEMLHVSQRTVRRWFDGRVKIMGNICSTPKKRRHRVFLITQQDLYDFMNERAS